MTHQFIDINLGELCRYQKLKRLTYICRIAVAAFLEYQSTSVMLPARFTNRARRDHMAQVCKNLKPRCVSISFEDAVVSGYWPLSVQNMSLK